MGHKKKGYPKNSLGLKEKNKTLWSLRLFFLTSHINRLSSLPGHPGDAIFTSAVEYFSAEGYFLSSEDVGPLVTGANGAPKRGSVLGGLVSLFFFLGGGGGLMKTRRNSRESHDTPILAGKKTQNPRVVAFIPKEVRF